ncbi:hypothetical protein EN742_05945 [Mesorhizobium sp. M4A.F.Ca.ET.020.02.1.1]|uniref:helix-turn-helix transcriptional regulator n=1 Tax=unclassified Mesorhizobium TaxID=325217 RepID=UPI000FD2367A|nr:MULTISPECIES: hypothetical protein [unclassified Mesorhizobium]RVD43066.1 hypothetical protein EN742_05945 [Mesorhizobium sp. M4A.F.Ca.ET.020.02.1.1]RWC14108.1 MAG: hypothetical protein EOS53_23080 [Mesorhizobium sp.]RWD33161.1 MAG: hypothetical protein EOS33_12065 [Mesorhizobium sp.]
MQAVQPRGLRRVSAAAYLGISPSHFDKARAAGNIPPAKTLFGVALWDRFDLDSLFDGKPTALDVKTTAVAANDNDDDWWDRACATGNRSS